MNSTTSTFYQRTARWTWRASAVLALVLSACVSETTSSTVANRIPPSTTIVVLASTVAASIAASTTLEEASPSIDTGSYEAVFLRLEVVDDTREVVVLGVNPQGGEREIARLSGAWVTFAPDSASRYMRPLGAVSPTGLLAMPTLHPGSERLMMQWEIFDLHRPKEAPVIIDGVRENVDFVGNTPYFQPDPRPGAFWGPGERLFIPWGPAGSGLQAFVEGRTGSVATVKSAGEHWELLPAWAADGSGVFVSGGKVLHPDGTQTDSTTAIREDNCKRQFESGAPISLPSAVGEPLACLAPDDSMIILIREGSYYQSTAGVLIPGAETWVEIEGSFAGWMAMSKADRD